MKCKPPSALFFERVNGTERVVIGKPERQYLSKAEALVYDHRNKKKETKIAKVCGNSYKIVSDCLDRLTGRWNIVL